MGWFAAKILQDLLLTIRYLYCLVRKGVKRGAVITTNQAICSERWLKKWKYKHFCGSKLQMKLRHTYKTLSPLLYSDVDLPLLDPDKLYLFNQELSEHIGLAPEGREVIQGLNEGSFGGGIRPFAQAYAGHQFGHFTMLGDGRAMVVGEQEDKDGRLYDIQLKGSGKTPYSRGGDGQATLYAMLREYLMGELMHALGVPSTRGLGVIETGDTVYREKPHRGAILIRVADSHIRVGTFEYAVRTLPQIEYTRFFQYVLDRHYPHLNNTERPGIAFLKEVMHQQIQLVTHWLRIGFIHGVMNTDNMAISGQTMDYGPCAFLNAYRPGKTFSSIDRDGRYAFGHQPDIVQWNIACLAGTLLPFIDADRKAAIEKVKEVIHSFTDQFQASYLSMMCAKIGISQPEPEDAKRIQDLLNMMEKNEWDYNGMFLFIANEQDWKWHQPPDESFYAWKQSWLKRVERCSGGLGGARELMLKTNPRMIPRNHLVEEVLEQAVLTGNASGIEKMIQDFAYAYQKTEGMEVYHQYPTHHDESYQTFCGT
jgi:serine/tyrosine/threonine adenylyltransferase